MKPNEVYFNRMKGVWHFEANFSILSWRGLFSAEIPYSSKLKLSALILVQKLFGTYQMWTSVDYPSELRQVQHLTWVGKFGFQVLKSEKVFSLDENGFDLVLKGSEYLWPLGWVPVPFQPLRGRVAPGSTRASYQMPMAGITVDCESIMESPRASIQIRTPWFEGVFQFDPVSQRQLESRPLPGA